jgi:hypothetical protein
MTFSGRYFANLIFNRFPDFLFRSQKQAIGAIDFTWHASALLQVLLHLFDIDERGLDVKDPA